MAELERLLIRLDADTERLRRELKKAEKTTVKSTTRMERATARIGKSFKRLNRAVGGLLPAIGAAGLGAAARSSIKDLAKLDDTAKKLGLTAESLQELRFAAQEVGVDTNTLDLGLQRFTRRLGEAAIGTGELKGTLDRYNIAVKNADGSTRETVDVLGDMANAIQGTKSQQEALAATFKGFDSEAAALVTLLQRGSAGMDELRQKARDLGLVIDDETVAAAKELDREFDIIAGKMNTVWKKAVVSFGLALDAAFNPIDETTTAGLEKRLDRLQRKLATPEAFGDIGLQRFEEERDAIMAVLEARGKLEKFGPPVAPAAAAAPVDTFGMAITPRAAGGVGGPREREAARFEAELATAQKALDDLDKEVLRSTGNMEALYRKLAEEQKTAIKALTGISDEERQKALANIDAIRDANIRALDDATAKAEQFDGALNAALQNAIMNGERLDKVLLRAMKSAILFGTDGRGGILGGILGKVTGGLAKAFTLPGFAAGGNPQVGVPSVVGEKGPEIFVPKVPGTVFSNADSRRMGGQTNTIVQHNTFTTDVRNTVRAEILNAAPLIAQLAAQQVRQAGGAVRIG